MFENNDDCETRSLPLRGNRPEREARHNKANAQREQERVLKLLKNPNLTKEEIDILVLESAKYGDAIIECDKIISGN